MQNDMITKEEKEQMLNRKIEEIRRKNEETMKKYKMKEEDRQLAEKSGCSVTLELASAANAKKDKSESVAKNSSSASDFENRSVKTAKAAEDWDGEVNLQCQSQANQLNRHYPRLPKDAVQNDKQPTKIVPSTASVAEDWDGDGTSSVPVTQQIRRQQKTTTTAEDSKVGNVTSSVLREQATQLSRRQPKATVATEDWDGDGTLVSVAQQGRRQPKTVTAMDDSNGDGTTSPSVAQQGRRQPPHFKSQPKSAQRTTHSLSEGPPPDPVYSFLADASRDCQPETVERSPKAASANISRRHPRNFGGERFEGVTEQMQQEKERRMNHRDPAPNGEAQSKMDYLLRTTGKERLEYEKWRAEQDKIDHERLQRHKNAAGEWRREWDREKVSQIEDGMGSVSLQPVTRQPKPPVTWQPQPATQEQQDQFTWQQQPTIRQLQSVTRPAGRIGSGRFASNSGDGLTVSSPSPSVPSNKDRRITARARLGSKLVQSQPVPKLCGQTKPGEAGSSSSARSVEATNDSIIIRIGSETSTSSLSMQPTRNVDSDVKSVGRRSKGRELRGILKNRPTPEFRVEQPPCESEPKQPNSKQKRGPSESLETVEDRSQNMNWRKTTNAPAYTAGGTSDKGSPAEADGRGKWQHYRPKPRRPGSAKGLAKKMDGSWRRPGSGLVRTAAVRPAVEASENTSSKECESKSVESVPEVTVGSMATDIADATAPSADVSVCHVEQEPAADVTPMENLHPESDEGDDQWEDVEEGEEEDEFDSGSEGNLDTRLIIPGVSLSLAEPHRDWGDEMDEVSRMMAAPETT